MKDPLMFKSIEALTIADQSEKSDGIWILVIF